MDKPNAKVVGRNILDEGFGGSNVKDTENQSRFSSELAEKLGQSVRAGMKRTSTADRNQFKVSNAVAALSKNIGNNTIEIQKLLENQNDETKNEISKLIKMLADAQKLTGEKSVKAIEKIQQQTEIIKLTAGEQGEALTKALGVNEAKQELKSSGSMIKSFFGVDQDAKGLEAVKQSVDPARLFGTQGFFGIGRNSAREKEAEREGKKIVEARSQDKGLENLEEDLLKDKGESNQNQKAVKNNTKAVKENKPKTSGSDRKPEEKKQTEFLEKILKELKKLNEKNFSGGAGVGLLSKAASTTGGFLATAGTAAASLFAGKKVLDALPDGTQPRTPRQTQPNTTGQTQPRTTGQTQQPGKPIKKPTLKPSMLSRGLGAVGKFGRFLGPVGLAATAATAAYGGFKGFNADPDADLGDKAMNAARGIGNVLSFGLIDSPEERMQQQQMQQPQIEANRNGEDSIMDGFVPNPTSLPDLSTRPLPTADAVDNMTSATNNNTYNSPTINNITNNNMSSSGGGQSNPLITIKDSIRDNTSIIQQRFNKLYA